MSFVERIMFHSEAIRTGKATSTLVSSSYSIFIIQFVLSPRRPIFHSQPPVMRSATNYPVFFVGQMFVSLHNNDPSAGLYLLVSGYLRTKTVRSARHHINIRSPPRNDHRLDDRNKREFDVSGSIFLAVSSAAGSGWRLTQKPRERLT
jgi:hypothetical protein